MAGRRATITQCRKPLVVLRDVLGQPFENQLSLDRLCSPSLITRILTSHNWYVHLLMNLLTGRITTLFRPNHSLNLVLDQSGCSFHEII